MGLLSINGTPNFETSHNVFLPAGGVQTNNVVVAAGGTDQFVGANNNGYMNANDGASNPAHWMSASAAATFSRKHPSI